MTAPRHRVPGIVLAGGRATRLGGVDKAAVAVGGVALLDRALAALAGCRPVLVSGPVGVLGGRTGALAVEDDPPYGGPAAGLLTAATRLSTLADDTRVVVVAVDHPAVTAETVARLHAALVADGAVLVDDQRRQPVLVLRLGALRGVAPGREEWPGLSLRWLLEPLDLAEVPAIGREADDLDTADDLRGWET